MDNERNLSVLLNDLRKLLGTDTVSHLNITEQDNEYLAEIGEPTPLGEDWFFILTFDGTLHGAVDALAEYANNFDVDDEAALWIEMRGTHGVPSSISDLVDDAEWKRDYLQAMLDTATFNLSKLANDSEMEA